jgi:hypothetical protein
LTTTPLGYAITTKAKGGYMDRGKIAELKAAIKSEPKPKKGSTLFYGNYIANRQGCGIRMELG